MRESVLKMGLKCFGLNSIDNQHKYLNSKKSPKKTSKKALKISYLAIHRFI